MDGSVLPRGGSMITRQTFDQLFTEKKNNHDCGVGGWLEIGNYFRF